MDVQRPVLFLLVIIRSVVVIANQCGTHAVSPGEKKVTDEIERQKDEVKNQQEKVKQLIDRVAAEIESMNKYSCPDIPVPWPDGTYGLPMPKSGCPRGSQKIPWHEGTRYQDTEDHNSRNDWSSPFHLAGYVNKNDMEQRFCMKTLENASASSYSWPKGQYCIFKKGNCPEGFSSGSIKWDDEDDSNKNTMNGTLPDGVYDRDTQIEYCCRKDGFPTNAIYLPIEDPFVLLKKGDQCQYVQKMQVIEDFLFWDTEDSRNRNTYSGDIPKATINKDIKLHYCYYYR